ncbi:unnamed protein product [Thelazia callipaeda]|uniref:Protein phosphatase 1 regulatory subunit 21 n=1 Tax=Thelazia callipaeda TaxID=103827 RepID=A0A0N5D4N8_THECL|nr:unnamed protein product [Thelazia callipaeda]
MSTISSNADITTKYQRVAAEYAKTVGEFEYKVFDYLDLFQLKVQVSVLKNAVVEERAKNEKLSTDLRNSEWSLRKAESEKEGFEFRNSQLVKRVEYLQNEIENAKHTSFQKRGSLFQKISRIERSAISDSEIVQLELQKKLEENEILHKKVSELENEYTEATSALNEQYRKLEIENTKLKEELQKVKASAVVNEKIGGESESMAENGASVNIIVATATQNLILPGDTKTVVTETLHVLWLDVLRTARTLTSVFANLLQLFEQRSTIYPTDINMEKLPERTLLFGQQLLSSGDKFEACMSTIDTILVKNTDDDCLNLSHECSKIASVFSSALSSCQEWQELFCESTADESRLSWCGTNLFRCNEDWTASFLQFLQALNVISWQIEHFHQSPMEIFDHIQKLPELSSDIKLSCYIFADCSRAFTAKIFDENRIPTATKRLRCVNDCINKCLMSLHRNLNSFVGLVQLVINSSDIEGKSAHLAVKNSDFSTALDSSLSSTSVTQVPSANSYQEASKEISYPKYGNLSVLQIEQARKRIVELEKQKERIIIDHELLKRKFESIKLSEAGNDTSDLPIKDTDVICSYFEERIGELHADVAHIRSRALYYKHECKDLLTLVNISNEENELLRKDLNDVVARESALKEELEMTRKSYEEKMRSLHEHIATLNVQSLEEQSKVLNSFKDASNGVNTTKQVVISCFLKILLTQKKY